MIHQGRGKRVGKSEEEFYQNVTNRMTVAKIYRAAEGEVVEKSLIRFISFVASHDDEFSNLSADIPCSINLSHV